MQEELYNKVIEYYDSQEWKYQVEQDEEDGEYHIRMVMSIEEIDSVHVLTVVREESITTYTYFPMDIPESKRVLISEFLTRTNYGLRIGNFEMDMEDGEVRYKVYSVWLDGILPSLPMLERYVDMGCAMMQRYGAAMMKVLYADMSPEDAVAFAEKKD